MENAHHVKHLFRSFNIGNVFMIVGSILGLILLKFIVTCFYNVYFHPLRRYPGPKLAAATGFLFFYKLLRGEEIEWEDEMHKKYGEIVRLGPDRLTYITPRAWKDIAGAGAGKIENTKDSATFPPNIKGEYSMGSQPITEIHRARRRMYAPAFSEKALRMQEPLILGYVQKLVNLIKDQATNPDAKIDIVKTTNLMTFDVMADLAFGEPLGLLELSEYTPWLKAVFGHIRSNSISRIALEYKPIKTILRMAMPTSVKKGAEMHYLHSYDRVVKRMEKGVDIGKPDIWKLVMEKGDQPHLSPGVLAADASSFMLAGTETTATLISGLTYLLLKNPTHLQRLQAEIRALKKEGMTLEALAHLPFMNACLTEGLRIYPAAPLALFRRVPKGGNVICGDWIPENTRVAVPHYAAYHHPLNFKDPDSFIPERWLPESGYDSDRKDVLNPFSVGPRNCIGQNLAWHEMRVILAHLTWHFDFELCPESDRWLDQKVFFLWDKSELLVKAKYIR